MSIRRQNRWRSFFAILCLIAVVLAYSPLGGVAWSLYSHACCTSGQCPIHGHHASQSSAASEHGMDCGHDMPAMAQCSMSCCLHPDRPAVTPVIFVLPAPPTVSAARIFESLVPAIESPSTFASAEPLSPPPRSSASAA